jgi:hypothetical protein
MTQGLDLTLCSGTSWEKASAMVTLMGTTSPVGGIGFHSIVFHGQKPSPYQTCDGGVSTSLSF